jgi:hypothetical protein
MKMLRVLGWDGHAVTINVDAISAITAGDGGKNVTVYTVGRDAGWQLLPDYTHAEVVEVIERTLEK